MVLWISFHGLLLAYHRQKGLSGVIVRLFNTVGPRQTGQYGMVVPRFVQQAVSGEVITVYGTGHQTRCFAHVLDVVPALHSLMNCDQATGKVVNIGNDIEVSINELAKRVREAVNSRVDIIRIPYEEAYEYGFEDMESRKPSLKRAKDLIGYNPSRGLEDIIQDVERFIKGKWSSEL